MTAHLLHPLESRFLRTTLEGDVLTVEGTPEDDRIRLSLNNQYIVVQIGDGNSSWGQDGIKRIIVRCGAGNDNFAPSSDFSIPLYIDGGAGNDALLGGTGNDTLTGGSGKNTLIGQAGDDRINGSGGRDSILGLEGSDRLYGNGGSDTLDGGGGVDRLFGGDGDDLLTGGGSNDKLYGEGGNDILHGKGGADLNDGGAGIDSADQDGSDSLVHIENVKTVANPQSLIGTYKGKWPLPGDPSFPTLGNVELTISSVMGSAITGIFSTILGTQVLPLSGTVNSSGKFTLSFSSSMSGADFNVSVQGTLKGNTITGYASVSSNLLIEEGGLSVTRV